jgi:putative DNA primase/helicase
MNAHTEAVLPDFASAPSEPTTAGQQFRWSEYGNAERLVHQHGRDLRYAPGVGWFVWEGRRWRRDGDGEVMRRMKRSVRTMWLQLDDVEKEEDQKTLRSWIRASESARRLQAAISLAASEHPVIVEADDLDSDPYLLCAANGTVDLRTGELREHRRSDLLTKITAVRYDPDARSDLWDNFLDTITGGNSELRSFLARAAGYSLTGDTREEKLFFLHGPTATGKSTFVETYKTTLGEYAVTANFETFLKRRGDAGVRNDLARLRGYRLVTSIEVDEGKQLAEGVVKAVTAGDSITVRFLYREEFEYKPRYTVWLAANERPRVNAADDAMWRRIIQIPFVAAIPEHERDPDVKGRLTTSERVQVAVLAWAVGGCLEWQRQGLNVPEHVADYTAEYRAENDPLRAWLVECAELVPSTGTFTSNADLRASYEAWCIENGERPVSVKTFANGLKNAGCERVKRAGVRGWLGIRLA